MDFKNINIGKLIETKCKEKNISTQRICNFLKCDEKEIQKIYNSKSIDTENLLRFSKLLEYDFFRIYTQHLILYSPPSRVEKTEDITKKSALPQFRKNIYTKEIIDFILDVVESKEKTKLQIIKDYKIPKATLYKWIEKYQKSESE